MSVAQMAGSVKIGILTISDRASQGVYEDKGGPAIRAWLTNALTSPWEAIARVIPDEQAEIEAALCELSDTEQCSLIVTTGGTGPALRDVTPEATLAVIDRELPGIAELMRIIGFKKTPTAVLSRAVAGLRSQCLIINLPGSPQAVKEYLSLILPVIPHAVDTLKGLANNHHH